MLIDMDKERRLECFLARWLALPVEDDGLVNLPKTKDCLENAVALDALAGLFACTYAYANDWPNDMRRYFSQGFKEGKGKESGVKYGFVQ